MGALCRGAIASAAAALALLAAGAGAAQRLPAAPPRATDRIALPKEPSQVAVDLIIDLADLERALERELPRQLWQIDRPGSECVASKTVDLALFEVKSPKIQCRIVGAVTRGRIRLGGKGQALLVTMPVTGTLAARDVAGIFKGQTGTGAAEVAMSLRLDLTQDWTIASQTRIDYRWTRAPGIDFLGRRITLTSLADRELAPVKRQVEQIVARELARLPVRPTAQTGWRAAHQVIELNRTAPAVWGRLTPQVFRFGGYDLRGRALTLRLGLDALFETYVGVRPEASVPGPLPPLARRDAAKARSLLHIPVIADYAVLEPIIAEALARRAAQPFAIRGFGTVTARFEDIRVYGTGEGRIAVGGRFAATSDGPVIKVASGTIWLTARPVSTPGSRAVGFADVAITGETDIVGEAFLFALANSPEFQSTITDALAQNFETDFVRLRGRIEQALAARKGDIADYGIAIENIATGQITAHGEGLYLPVDVTARVSARLKRLN